MLQLCWMVCLHFAANAQFWQPQFILGGETHRYTGGYYGGGVSIADFDKDGWDDVLYCQNGDVPTFLRSIEGQLQPWPLGITETGEMKQLTWVDFDNDGDRDLSLTGFNIPIQLFRRESSGLIPLPAGSGIPQETIVGYGHSWGDYDRDGDLDLFVCTYDADFMGFGNSNNRLYRNEGNAVFTDVTLIAGFAPMQNYTFMAIWMDYNRDLYPDLFVTNDRLEVPNYFYHNNGDGTFTEIAAQINLDDYLFSMTATSDDYDNDGDLDVYITNGTSGNYHKRNDDASFFSDVNVEQGTTLNRFCWSALFIDANRDGLQDLHICSTPHISLPGQNFLYLNSGQEFTLANDSAGISSDDGWSRSAAMGDFNRDGLADLAVSKTIPSYSSMWRAIPNSNNWMKVTLEGVESNRDGVSSWIDCYSNNQMQSRYTFCGEGYLAQSSFSEFFGLGSETVVDSMVVHWPSGIIDRWYRIPANQQLHLVEGTSRPVAMSTSNGLTLCGGDSLEITLNQWTDYSWSNGDSAQVLTTADPGIFTALVTDEWGNMFLADTVQVFQAELPIVEVVVEHVSCTNYSDAIISAQANIPGVEFSLNGSINSNGEFIGLSSGQFQLEWTDSNGCASSQQVIVTEPDPLGISVQVNDASCNGAADGSVILTFVGGTPGYELLPESSSTELLTAGTYPYIVMDSQGCTSQIEAEVQESLPLVIEAIATADSNSTSSGSISAIAAGGTPPYSYLLNGQPSEVALWQQISGGNYTLEVYDSLGCNAQLNVIVESVNSISTIQKGEFVVFPNPVMNAAIIHVQSHLLIHHCSVVSSQGALVFTIRPEASNFEITTAGWIAGCYTLTLQTNVGPRYVRLIVLE